MTPRLAIVAGGLAAALLFSNPAAAAPVQADNAEIAVQALFRHGLLAETAPDGPAQINADGSAAVGGLTVQPQTAGQGLQAQPGLLIVRDTQDSADTVVQNVDAGVRYMSVLKDAAAPTAYEYRFPSAALTKQEDGSVAVRGADGSAAVILPAWAKDANGAAVPTHYDVRGDVLIQHINHVGFAYPIVADPGISTCLISGWRPAVCVKYNRSEVRRVKNLLPVSAGATAAIAALCGLIPTGTPPTLAARAACAGIFAGRAAEITSKVNDAWNSGRCLEVRIPYPMVTSLGAIRVVNC